MSAPFYTAENRVQEAEKTDDEMKNITRDIPLIPLRIKNTLYTTCGVSLIVAKNLGAGQQVPTMDTRRPS